MLRTVKAGGKDRPFLFAYRAIRDLERGEKPKGLDQVELAGYYGFKYGAIAQKQEVDFKQEDVAEWIEQDVSLIVELKTIIAEATETFVKDLSEGKPKAP